MRTGKESRRIIAEVIDKLLKFSVELKDNGHPEEVFLRPVEIAMGIAKLITKGDAEKMRKEMSKETPHLFQNLFQNDE